MTLAESHEGQFLFHLLAHLGMTPAEWRNLDPRDMMFLRSAFSFHNQSVNNAHKQAEQEAKAKGLSRRRR